MAALTTAVRRAWRALRFPLLAFLVFWAGYGYGEFLDGPWSPARAPRVGAAYIPPAGLWGLTNVRYIVSSAYSYEASVLGGSPPVEDSDYLLPYAASELIHLPGGAYDHYVYDGSVYVPGSGWVIEFGAPNGGRFALLHMQTAMFVRPEVSARTLWVAGTPRGATGYDQTGYTLRGTALRRPAAVPSSVSVTYPGGAPVGYTGWPTWAAYANGVPGPGDAHACLVADAWAALFFYRVARGLDQPVPKPVFPATRYEQYRLAHHRRPLAYRDARHRLVWAARVWWPHARRLGGILHPEQWFGPTTTRRLGYERDSYQGGAVFLWPRTRAAKVTYWQHWTR